MRTTVTIRDELYREAKAAAAREGGSVGSVIERALQAYLERAPVERPVATLPVFEGLVPQPGIDFSRSSELLHELDLAIH